MTNTDETNLIILTSHRDNSISYIQSPSALTLLPVIKFIISLVIEGLVSEVVGII